MQRRDVLAGLGAALGGALPNFDLFAAGACVLTPQTEDGPFYFDPKLIRADITEGKPGVPLELEMRVVRLPDCVAIEAARTDVWQVDALGVYSGYDEQTGAGRDRTLSAVGQTFLRGTQFTDAGGAVVFTTIYPSWYTGRTPHIHFKVFLAPDRVVTSQIFFPDDTNEAIFGKVEPYRARDPARDAYNHNDAYLENGTLGVLCDVTRRAQGYRAAVTVGVAAA